MSNSFDILLVEDNADLAGNIIDYLEALGHRLHYAADGESGLREALVSPVDIVLLDLALPNRDGLSVCAEIRHRADRRVPILMLTARDTLDDKLAGFASGADSLRAHLHLLRQVVDKPFDLPIIETLHSIGFRLKVEQ